MVLTRPLVCGTGSEVLLSVAAHATPENASTIHTTSTPAGRYACLLLATLLLLVLRLALTQRGGSLQGERTKRNTVWTILMLSSELPIIHLLRTRVNSVGCPKGVQRKDNVLRVEVTSR